MKKYVIFSIICAIFFGLVFSFNVFASDDFFYTQGITYSEYRGQAYGSYSHFRSSDKKLSPNYTASGVWEIPADYLHDSSSLSFVFNSIDLSGYQTVQFVYSPIRLTPNSYVDDGEAHAGEKVLLGSTSSSFRALVTLSKTGVSVFDLTQSSYFDEGYYYIFAHCSVTTSRNASAFEDVNFAKSMGSVVVNFPATPTPTATLKPTAQPTATVKPSSSPKPTVAPTSAPTPSPEIKKSVLIDSLQVPEGQTKSSSLKYEVFPESVEVATTSNIKGEYPTGNSYIMHYKAQIPARFIYSGHIGTAYSDPQVVLDSEIEYYGYKYPGSYIFQYSKPTFRLESASGLSIDYLNTMSGTSDKVSGKLGFTVIGAPVLDSVSVYSYNLIVEWDVVCTTVANTLVFANESEYSCDLKITSVNYVQDGYFNHISDSTDSSLLEQIRDEQKAQNDLENERYEQEQDKIHEAADTVTSSFDEVTTTLTSWEIFTMPVTLIGEFVTAISSSGSTSLTFPSFELMGLVLWPAYTFDLQYIASTFPVLYNALHLISGILIVIAFVRYLWRKWSILMGDDMPDEDGK